MMLTRFSILVLIVAPLVQAQHYPIPDYQLRRPLQYFFHLLELKVKLNPMLSTISSVGVDCSSKAGPFCALTEHPPLQTHELRPQQISPSHKSVHDVLISQQWQSVQGYQSIASRSNEVFLVRSEQLSEYQKILKERIGDRMHLNPVLPAQRFQRLT